MKRLKAASAIRTNNAMLMLPFWQTNSINTSLHIEPSLTLVLRKFG
jgi:hypothetical protein